LLIARQSAKKRNHTSMPSRRRQIQRAPRALSIAREHVQHNSIALSLDRQDFGLAIDIEHTIIA
jgi:hypothetical protein